MGSGRRRRTVLVLAGVVVLAVVGLVVSLLVGSKNSAATSTQYGVNVYVADNCEPAAGWVANATNEMKSIKSLGANSVAIDFPFYTTGLEASSVFTANQCHGPTATPYAQSPSPARVAVLVRAAQAEGLQVLLRPSLYEGNLDGQWRGDILPANRSAWFASYDQMLKPYLEMAQSNSVARFTISLELESLTHTPYWPATIAFARKLYTGQLVFATSWRGSLPHGRGEVHKHTSVAIDTYPVTSAAPTSSVAQILSGWNAYLAAKPFGTLDRNVTIDEAGIVAVDGAYRTSWIYLNGTFNQTIQANWFKAACEFTKDHKLGGIYFWGPQFTYNFGNLTAKPDPGETSELQPAAQAAIRACFK
ncbi:MAG: hypothetical protein ABSC41_18545 [Acidimicrobiales bacterium]